jgi:hypothetical protein
MKNVYVLVTMLIIGFSVEAQQNRLPNIEVIDGNIPEWLNDSPPENMLWGIGTGKLSNDNASCELAKFNAQANLCQQISGFWETSYTELDNPSLSEKNLLDELNLYKSEFYNLLCSKASEEASFELSELIKVERRTKTKDGIIWYLVSIQKNITNNVAAKIEDYEKNYINSYTENLK